MRMISAEIVAPPTPYIHVLWEAPTQPPPLDPNKCKVSDPPGAPTPRSLSGWVARAIVPAALGAAGTKRWVLHLDAPDIGVIDWIPTPGRLVDLQLNSVRITNPVPVFPAQDGLGQIARDLSQIGVTAAQGVRDLGDAVAFPATTSGGAIAPGGPSAAASSQALVDTELSRLLGRKPSVDDVDGTLAMLDRALQFTENDGVERWERRPGGMYAIQTDIGAGITGRQASLARLASESRDEIKPLVQDVAQLAPTTNNPSDLVTARSNFLCSLDELVAEAAAEAGPLGAKVRVLLDQSIQELARLGEGLGMLQQMPPRPGRPQRYRPTRQDVITPGDEDQFTSFMIVVDRYLVLDNAFRRFASSPAPQVVIVNQPPATSDRGRRFTLLNRRIDVISEAVDELDAALLSVGIDREERRALPVDPVNDPGGPKIQDLMDWAQHFPEREARPLIQSSGVRGARLLPARLRALRTVVQTLVNTITTGGQGVPAGLRHPRVQVAAQKLRDELRAAEREATGL
jgi:hypothetical protein